LSLFVVLVSSPYPCLWSMVLGSYPVHDHTYDHIRLNVHVHVGMYTCICT
jgi:hypothetical protein